MAENQPEKPFQVLLGEGAVQDLTRMRDAAAAEAKQYPDDKSPAHNANRTLYKGVPQLDRFGEAQVGSGGKAHQRNPVLDANRAIAHAFDGQTPLSGSRPLSETGFGSRASSSGARQAGKQARPQVNPHRGE